jgi:hypothetical protein
MSKAVDNEDWLNQIIHSEYNGNDDNNIPVNTAALLSSLNVLGLDSNTNGRMCNQHKCCGRFVERNDVLYCSWQLQTVYPSCDTNSQKLVQPLVTFLTRNGAVSYASEYH